MRFCRACKTFVALVTCSCGTVAEWLAPLIATEPRPAPEPRRVVVVAHGGQHARDEHNHPEPPLVDPLGQQMGHSPSSNNTHVPMPRPPEAILAFWYEPAHHPNQRRVAIAPLVSVAPSL